MDDVDVERVARELLRALRGSRSQLAFSRRLGYRTNVAYPWEAGRRWPAVAEVFRAAERVGVDVRAGLKQFFSDAAWVADVDLRSADGVALLLRELRGDTALSELARRAGVSRFALGRWSTGRAMPRIHEVLAVVEAATGRLPDFVAGFVSPASMPSLAERWAALEARRGVASQAPWAAAVLRALELDSYRALPAHRPGWIAERLGIPVEVEATTLGVLERAGAIAWRDTRYALVEGLTVDTRRGPDAGRQLQIHWAKVGIERLEARAPGLFGYNVFTVSTSVLTTLQQMHRAHFSAMRAVIAASDGADCVVVANLQLFELAAPPQKSGENF